MNLQRDSATGQEMLSKHVEKWKSGKWKKIGKMENTFGSE